jgi:glycolate oxidase
MIADSLRKDFIAILGREHYLEEPEELVCYGYDASAHSFRPDAVAMIDHAERLAALVRVAAKGEVPLIPRGAGTGMSGGSLPVRGGLVVNLAPMHRIIDVDGENLTAHVEAGVINEDFRKVVEARGLFYPPDPASLKMCTLGGNVAENAGGPLCLKYGVTRDYVLGLEVVLPDGDLIVTGSRVIKDVTGYDLTGLMTGSEGTLGIITKIYLKLIPLPESRRTVLAAFPRMEDAASTVSAVIAARILPATLEFMDNTTIRVVEDYLHIGLPLDAGALLLIETDGYDLCVRDEMERIVSLCGKMGATSVKNAKDVAEAESLWRARRAVSSALGRVSPRMMKEDVAVPRTRIPELLEKSYSLFSSRGLTLACFGHAGDGNIHMNVLVEKGDEEYRKAEAAVGDLFALVISLGGVISGEHGIGCLKNKYLKMGLDAGAVKLMQAMKALVDPKGIMNPGKVFPDE